MSDRQQEFGRRKGDRLAAVKKHGNTPYCPQSMMELNPAVGCQFECRYCMVYMQRRVAGFPGVVLYEDYPAHLEDYLSRHRDARHDEFYYLSPKTDCLEDCLIETGLLESILRLLLEYDVTYFIATKGGAPPEKIQDLLKAARDRNTVIVSCSAPTEELRKRLEPHAASNNERLHFAASCIENGIFTTASLSPILPLDDLSPVKELIARFIEVGVSHFRLDFPELSGESLSEMMRLVPEYRERFEQLYSDPAAEVTSWDVPYPDHPVERTWPPVSYMREAFRELVEFAKQLDPKATASICNRLVQPWKIPGFNEECTSRGICCIGARYPGTSALRPDGKKQPEGHVDRD